MQILKGDTVVIITFENLQEMLEFMEEEAPFFPKEVFSKFIFRIEFKEMVCAVEPEADSDGRDTARIHSEFVQQQYSYVSGALLYSEEQDGKRLNSESCFRLLTEHTLLILLRANFCPLSIIKLLIKMVSERIATCLSVLPDFNLCPGTTIKKSIHAGSLAGCPKRKNIEGSRSTAMLVASLSFFFKV